jgi:hypothetical protein
MCSGCVQDWGTRNLAIIEWNQMTELDEGARRSVAVCPTCKWHHPGIRDERALEFTTGDNFAIWPVGKVKAGARAVVWS